MALGEHDKSREAIGVEADCPCQATRCLAKPIVAVVRAAVKSKDHRPRRGTPKFTRYVNLVPIFNPVQTNGAIQEENLVPSCLPVPSQSTANSAGW
jgi:hypothetical protein